MHDTENKMLFPFPVATDDVKTVSSTQGCDLLSELPTGGFFDLHRVWGNKNNLPQGYDYYVVSFHLEYINFDWLEQQQVDGPIIVLIDFNTYSDTKWPKNCKPMRWIYWHHALNQMIEWFGTEFTKQIKYKASVFCNRISQAKIIATTALLETCERENLLVSVSDWVEDKNVHYWQPTGNVILDQLTDTFRQKYLGTVIRMDNFDNNKNTQRYNADPSQIAYQEASLHFTNESYHYSKMNDQTVPGPMLTEKTFKCLLGATAFISVGQFDVYRTLEELGFSFEYGEIDLAFDRDSGNLSRLESIVKLIPQLMQYSADDLYDMTRESSEHNQQLIVSGEFFHRCQTINTRTLEQIQNLTNSLTPTSK